MCVCVSECVCVRVCVCACVRVPRLIIKVAMACHTRDAIMFKAYTHNYII